MLTLKAKSREATGKKVRALRKSGIIPAVLYGPKIKPQPVEVKLSDFKKIFKEAGESSLITLDVSDKKFLVLIHDLNNDPLTSEVSHIDFYQPQLDKEVEATVPIIFEGESAAIKDLEGTLIKEIHEVKVKALPQNLPHNIKVDISVLKTFADEIKIKDLQVPGGVKIQKDPEDIVVHAGAPTKVVEELEKPIEEKVEDVEKVETKKEKPQGEAEAEPVKKQEPAKKEEKK